MLALNIGFEFGLLSISSFSASAKFFLVSCSARPKPGVQGGIVRIFGNASVEYSWFA